MADSDRTWNGLVPMDDADVEMAENEPDPRGWDVIAADGRKIGEVDELLVDTAAMKVRYLDVDVDEDELHLDDADRRLMIPVRSVELDEDDEKVIVSGLESSRIGGFHGTVDLASSLGGGTFTDRGVTGTTFGATSSRGLRGDFPERGDIDGESGVRTDFTDREAFDTTTRSADTGLRTSGTERVSDALEGRDGEVRIRRVEEQLDVDKRAVKAGEVGVHKTVETEHVSEPVELRHEEVEIERRPVDREAGLNARDVDIGETHIRVPLTEEQAIARKRPVVREELVLRKRTVTNTENVGGDVRRERIHVDREGQHVRGDVDDTLRADTTEKPSLIDRLKGKDRVREDDTLDADEVLDDDDRSL